MTARKMQREKEERQRRLSEKIGAALMAGSLSWTPGGPMSWAFVLGGIVISQQETAYAAVTSTYSDPSYSSEVVGYTGHTQDDTQDSITVIVSAADGSTGPVFNNGACVYGNVNNTSGGTAKNASVTVSGGTIGSDVYGGYAKSGGTVSGNTVNLYSGTIVNGSIYGGYKKSGIGDVITGNTLNIGNQDNRVFGLSAVNIANFQNLNFYLPSNIAANDIVLTLSDATADTMLGSASAKANISAYLAADTTLASGSKVYLINKTGSGTLIVYTSGGT